MNKKLLLTGALSFLLGWNVQAQVFVSADSKWDASVERILRETKKSTRAAGEVPLQELLISSSNPQLLSGELESLGIECNVVGSEVVTANVPVDQIEKIAVSDAVRYLSVPRTFSPLMKNSRTVTNVEEVHAGEGLETPFTGKNVIVGVIDQSFEYKHRAFLNDSNKTRLVAYWNPTTKKMNYAIPNKSDSYTAAKGHGAHVANIAAGSVVEGSNYHGMAPEADLIFAPSKFDENDVLNITKAISDYAKKAGKPYVINMSFGSQMGPHDGTTTYDKSMSEYSVEGGILVAAMGNEGGENLHATYEFKTDGETKYVVFERPSQTFNYVELWGTNPNGKQNLTIRPFVFNKLTKAKDFKDNAFWSQVSQFNGSISPNNLKETYTFYVTISSMVNGLTNPNNYLFGLEIKGNTGDGFHLWVNPQYGEVSVSSYGSSFVKGDNEYCVGEGAASIPEAVAVASFNGSNGSFYSHVQGGNLSYNFAKGQISYFSSRGPWLGDGMKPAIAAPGAAVLSAFNKYDKEFSTSDAEITSVVTVGASKYYYGVMSGTSMASPAAAGIIALWLQANPQLTYEDVLEIFKETAIKDGYTGKQEWNTKFGYGKIDAYEGLKKALVMAETSGINDMHNSLEPVSLMKEANQWKVLFNNDESYADIALYTTSGKQVQRHVLNNLRRGNETFVSFDGLQPGVYLLTINTTLGKMTRKVMVK